MHRNKPHQFTFLEASSPRPPASRHESTEILLMTQPGTMHHWPTTKPSKKPFFVHPSLWMWELLSLAAAALVLVTVIVILAVYDGKPSPVLGGITLNTMIALAATLFRICLMVPVTDCICQLTWI